VIEPTFVANALALLGVALAVTLAAAVMHKVLRGGLDTRRARLQARMRPALLELVDGEARPQRRFRPTRRGERRVLRRLAAEHLPKVKGDAHEALVAWLRTEGELDRAAGRVERRHGVAIAPLHRRARATHLLGEAGDATQVAAVVAALTDRSRAVQVVAARALGGVRDTSSAPALLAAAAAGVPASVVTRALLGLAPAPVGDLRAALRAPDATVRSVAADVLGRSASRAATGDLARTVERDPIPFVRARAAAALGWLDATSAVGSLAGALQRDPIAAVRKEAAISLGRIGGADAAHALEAGLHDEQSDIVQAAAEALLGSGPAGAALLHQYAARADRSGAYAREVLALAALTKAQA
jgi:HEAT repeat protein